MAGTAEFPFASSFPTGFGFRPTEEELITYYLKNKNVGKEYLVRFIKEIDLYKFDPEQLPEKSFIPSDNFEWFFFRANTSNTKRTTTTGCWKSTGKPRRIKARGTNELIGTRHIFVFHRGKGARAVKTNWVIHEYMLHPLADITSQPFIIIRLKENAEERHVCDQEDGQNSAIASHRTKKVTQVGAIREMNRGEQSICEPLGSCTQQPVDAYDDDDGENENLTQFVNSLIKDGSLDDDATSRICRSPLRSEVNKQSFESEFDVLMKLVSDDKKWEEMTSNNHFNRRNNKTRIVRTHQLQSGRFQLQGGYCCGDTNTNNTYGLIYVAVALLGIIMFAKMWCYTETDAEDWHEELY
ncbi:NAC domain-containing protein 72-like [Cucurbita pepo subsp. pepo]|uniref:NAC domain-containing protein 72-like n=1 Tax=Cucurbita pepo subsp. pepo TaxID=3664 RepID=UPI000C9D8C32|nr:NAC domain-containing protein 72-like [Cucurbita pepo subsp. pepo]